MGQISKEDVLSAIRKVGENIEDSDLLKHEVQLRLHRCCSSDEALELLLFYIVVERKVPIKEVARALKVINGSRYHALMYERIRLGDQRSSIGTNLSAEGIQLVDETASFLAGTLKTAAPRAEIVPQGPFDMLFSDGTNL